MQLVDISGTKIIYFLQGGALRRICKIVGYSV